MKKLRLFSLAVILCGIAALSVMPVEAAVEPQYGGTLVTAIHQDPSMLVSTFTSMVHNSFVSCKIFNSLVRFDTKWDVLGDLALSWDISSDGLTYTFRLPKDVTFHDGKPMTSSDVKFSIETSAAVNPYSTLLKTAMDKVETPDANTVVLKLKFPSAAILANLSPRAVPILPKHLYEGTDMPKNKYNMEPIGTGPFRYVEYAKGSQIVLAKNEKYWKKDAAGKPLPYLDKIIIKIVPDSATRASMFQAGELDWLPNYYLPVESYETIKALKNVAVTFEDYHGTGIVDLQLNLRPVSPITKQKNYLSDVTVRRAIFHAIDRKDIKEKLYGDTASVAPGTIPSTMPQFYDPNIKLPEYDPAKANKLLDDAGYKKGADGYRFSLEVVTESGRREFIKVCELVQSYLDKVGIKINLVTLEAGAMSKKVGAFEFEILQSSYVVAPDPTIAIERMFMSKYITSVYRQNQGGYNNSRVDALFNQAAREVDVNKRKQLFSQIQQILAEDLPYIWLVEKYDPGAYWANKIGGGIPYSRLGYMENTAETIWFMKAPAKVEPTLFGMPMDQAYMVIGAVVVVVVVAVVALVYMRKRARPAK